MGNRPLCSDCTSSTAWLTLDDGTAIHLRTHAPKTAGADLPAVLVVHGYLANIGFVEMPWANDLTNLGIVAAFLDRRGHGKSGGDWWPPPDNVARHLAEWTPDINAAVAHLRNRAPLLDPNRIAVLGHSDGGTGAIIAASADWDLAATVSLSASVAPWEFVNYVAPRNLLLLYGTEDRFILAETDRLLMRAATRGYLDGEGNVGSLSDGSARRLQRVDGFGHVDLLYSSAARHAALEWLTATFAIDREVRLSALRWPWVVAGLLLLWLLVLTWNGLPSLASPRESLLARSLKSLTIATLWTAGLWIAATVGPSVRNLPVQESNIVAGVLLAPGAPMGIVALAMTFSRRGSKHAGSNRLRCIAMGIVAGLAVQIAAEAILRPIYAPAINAPRIALFLALLLPATFAFAATCSAANWLPNGQIAPGVPIEIVLGLITAVLAMPWFIRMSAFPVVLLAGAMLFAGAFRAGGGSAAGAAAFGAVIYARLASAVCAFY